MQNTGQGELELSLFKIDYMKFSFSYSARMSMPHRLHFLFREKDLHLGKLA